MHKLILFQTHHAQRISVSCSLLFSITCITFLVKMITITDLFLELIETITTIYKFRNGDKSPAW